MKELSLNGAWQFRRVGEAEWLRATVPGCNFTDLLAAGRIPDPFVADNELKVQWAPEADWEYRRVFQADAALLACPRVYLECDGLDTLATVFINGRRVGVADNMFRPWRFDVKKALRAGANEILVRFRSPTRWGRAQLRKEFTHQANMSLAGAPWVRKAQCQFGWDWGPKLPPTGIWRPLRLAGYGAGRVADVHLRQEHRAGKVVLSAQVEVVDCAGAPLRVELRLRYPDGTEQLADGALDPRAARWSTRVEVFNPQLWWPNGYGGQPLYDVTVALYGPDGAPLDQHAKRIGLRTLELRRRKDKFGESFVFVVNGVPIFAKGANWIPADSFPNRVTPERYRFLLQSAAQAHMNMIRVWGGGFYEEEVFYDLCDELGLLVWQDFTFACAVYPTNARFVESFRQEAVEALRRLRHRACLALWCGNNEMEEGWVEWGWGKRFPAKSKQGYDHLYHRLLPAWVAREDPDTPYWPSSPSSGRPFDKPNAEERGDGHYWKVWFAMAPFTEYRKHLFRFMSEFGFQSLPPFETVKTFAEPRDWNMTSRIMEHHQRSGPGNSKIIYQLLDQFRLPKDFASLCYLTQVLQAEGIRYGVEHWRRHRQRVMGILYWQLDDCWPVCSWSSIDYFGRWKALHYAARRFFAPVLLSAEEQGSRVDLHVTNDGRQPFAGRAAWRLETLAGEVIKRGELPLRARPSANTRLKRLDFARELTPDSRRALILVYELLTAAGDLLSRGVLSFVPHKHVELCDPGLQAELTDDGSEWRVTLRARALARFVEVSFEDVIAVWSDNFFDLPAGCERVVSCAKQPGQTLEALRGKLRVRSLWDSY